MDPKRKNAVSKSLAYYRVLVILSLLKTPSFLLLLILNYLAGRYGSWTATHRAKDEGPIFGLAGREPYIGPRVAVDCAWDGQPFGKIQTQRH